jgi:hypothetical protein
MYEDDLERSRAYLASREQRAARALAERQAAYMARMTRCLELLNALQDWAGSMGDVIPDEVTWANVGDASKVVCELVGVGEFLGREVDAG